MPAEVVEYFINKIWREESGEKGRTGAGEQGNLGAASTGIGSQARELRLGAYSRVVNSNWSSYEHLMKICKKNIILSSGE
jgi:hypothetical protein